MNVRIKQTAKLVAPMKVKMAPLIRIADGTTGEQSLYNRSSHARLSTGTNVDTVMYLI